MNSCLIIAGEKSAEEHALSFMPGLVHHDIQLYGVGSSVMEQKGVELLYNYKEFSAIGLSEVLGKISYFKKVKKHILDEAQKRDTKWAILIDFQTFNMSLAQDLHKRGVKVFYYVAPQAWVWKSYRVKILKEVAYKLFTIIPFEEKWFKDRGVTQTLSVTHPQAIHHRDSLKSKPIERLITKPQGRSSERKWKILLLPGSRKVEIKNLIPTFFEALYLLKDNKVCDFSISVLSLEGFEELIEQELRNLNNFRNFNLEIESFYYPKDLDHAMRAHDLALASSGTVTLTCALFQLPTIVCYKLSWLTEIIFKSVSNYDGPVSLANIVLGERIYPELTQSDFTRYKVFHLLRDYILNDQLYKEVVRKTQVTLELLDRSQFDVGKYMQELILSHRLE